MSDLLNSASLVMIPSGYKEDVVYSQIPTDGSGDMAFTRASNGTRVNSAGLVEVTPWNFLEQSEALDNAAWTSINTTETIGATAPDGTATAWTLSKSAASGRLYQVPSVISGTVTFSVYAKAGTTNEVSLETGNSFRTLDLSTGSLVSGGVGNYNIESVGNGWYRFSIVDSAYSGVAIYVSPTANTSGNILVWHPQYNIGATAKPYFPTTDRLNVPRLTYQNGGGGCPSLLLEKQSTNVLRNSEDFSQSTWAKLRTSITANAITSPDGTQNADKAIANTDNSDHSVFDNTITSTSPATLSIYAKAGEYNYIFLGYDNGLASQGAFFNLSNGTISQNTSTLTASIQSVGNGWYRCVVSSGTSNWSTIYSIIALSENGTSFVFAGDGSKGIYIWGAQAEASSYATSLIPTTSSSATRVADACFKTGISSLFGTNQGTFFVDIANAIELDFPQVTIDDNSNTNRIVLYREATNGYWGIFLSASGATASYSSTVSSIGGKFAIAYNSSGFLLYKDGTQILSFSNTVPSSISAVRYNGRATGDFYTNKEIKEFVLFPTKLTATELASLTA